MKEQDNFKKNTEALIAEKEQISKKLKSLHEELYPLMLKDNNTNEELVRMDNLITEESELINKDHEISMKLLDSLGETINAFDEELKKL